jgi:probable HAF family extracellular repeat protein
MRCLRLALLGSLLSCSLLIPAVGAAPVYEFTNLGAYLPSTAGSVAQAINNQGQIVINSADAAGPSAYLWQLETVTKIGSQGSTFNAMDLNELGQVVGTGGFAGVGTFAYIWDQTSGITLLDPLGKYAGSAYSVAMGVNNLGQVAGRTTGVYEPYGAAWWDVDRSIHALDRWGSLSQAYDINDNGTVVGWRETGNVRRGFVWNETTGFIEIGTFGGSGSSAVGINEDGLVYGDGESIDGASGPFIWTQTGGLVQLLTPDNSSGHARGANNNSQVVGGVSFEGETHAALWDGDDFFDLKDLVSLEPGWTLTEANDINDNGQIVGRAINGTSSYAFLLTPVSQVPEPETYTMMLAGLGLVGYMARRRK